MAKRAVKKKETLTEKVNRICEENLGKLPDFLKPEKPEDMNNIVKKAINLAIGASKDTPPVISTQFRLKGDQYFNSLHPKTYVMLHHTEGSTFRGAFDWWNQTPDHVGTAYIVDKDGTIYEVFPPENYAYHTGNTFNKAFDKFGVGIEIVSRGQLYKDGDQMVDYPNYPNKLVKVPIKDPNSVIELTESWRGSKYYERYSDAQIISVTWLVLSLVKRFGISLEHFNKDFYQYNPEVAKQVLPGVWSHTTVRSDKNDICPQPDLLEALIETLKRAKI